LKTSSLLLFDGEEQIQEANYIIMLLALETDGDTVFCILQFFFSKIDQRELIFEEN